MSQDEYQFSQIHADYRAKILRYLTRLVGEAEAEDLTQEVFIKVNRAFEGFKGEAKLSKWIYRIATNAAIDRMRNAAFQRYGEESNLFTDGAQEGQEIHDRDHWTGEAAITVESEFVRKEMNACIRTFIQNLPENYRTVLVLRELEGFRTQDIAEILDLSLNTVKIRLHRARQKLKVELETHCEGYWLSDNEFVPDFKYALDEYKKTH